MPRKAKSSPRLPKLPSTDAYRQKKKQTATYLDDSSLASALGWDDPPRRGLVEYSLVCVMKA